MSALCDARCYDLDGDALAELYEKNHQWSTRSANSHSTYYVVDGHLALGLTMNVAKLSSWCVSWRGMFVVLVALLPLPRRWSLCDVHNAYQLQPRCLWRSFNELLGRCLSPSAIVATDLQHYFDDKVADFCTATADADRHISACHLWASSFSPGMQDDVIALVLSLPDMQCSSDPLPTWLLKANFWLLAPFLCCLLNPLDARRFFANFPLAPDVFSSPKNVATPRELSYL